MQNAVSRGIPNLVLWSRDIVPLAEMTTRSRAPSVYSDREVGNSAEVGYFEPGLDYCLGGSRFGFFWQIFYVGPAVVAVVLCAGVSEGKKKISHLYTVLTALLFPWTSCCEEGYIISA